MLAEDRIDDESGTQYAIEQALKKAESNPELQGMVARLYKNFSQVLLTVMADLPSVKGLNSSVGAESIALFAQEGLKHDQLVSKKARLKLQGQLYFRQQIEESGGVYSTKEVADLLGVSASAVRKRHDRNGLLSVPVSKNPSYPVWQFDEQGVIKHFPEILDLLKTTSPVGAVQFFLTYDEDLGQTPIDALKSGDTDKLDMVRTLAAQFNQQVAR
jgi:hypothetical protein